MSSVKSSPANQSSTHRIASNQGATHPALESDPRWYKEAIIYQLHVKAFCDGDGNGIGDFKGLTSKLDYISELGINTIWLLPFYPSPFRDDGYDISDYMDVHPQYGTVADFKEFLTQAHNRGIRVITELVVNHTSDQHSWFQAARTAKPGSAERNFYVWSDTDKKYAGTRIIFCDTETSNWAWDETAQAYYWHRFYSHQPDLNLDNPQVLAEIIKVLEFWLDMGVDGFRLDAVPYLCEREGTNNENLPETHQVIKKIRAAVDAKYSDRVLLAEANQWPEDLLPYFGDGDECQMAFHFPLMPRIFMSLRREDRAPIIDIMDRTPQIPSNCQWGLFLRNHDELTLEMVSSEDRDYMWQEYASEPRMRINLGIRRRLAPLVNNSFRRLELLNSLLLSFPGSPIVYYGDEIGMGDNIYLGDRDGVRTPMQWTSALNCGFSKAEAERLYLPVILDAVYGCQRVNVEAQQQDPSSLLQFMKRIIGIRRQYKAFGRGSFEFLHPKNKRVLAYIRRYKNEVILAVANLSRFTQPVELDLRQFDGWVPMEIFGRTEFPQIGELPYLLTLGPHNFYWFRLEPEPEPITVALSKIEDRHQPLALLVEDLSQDIFQNETLKNQVDDVLIHYLLQQPWFKGGSRQILDVSVIDDAKIGAGFHWLLIQITYNSSEKEVYSLPVRITSGRLAESLITNVANHAVAIIKSPHSSAVLIDALYDKTACRTLLSLIYNDRCVLTAQSGTICGSGTNNLDLAIETDSDNIAITAVENRTDGSILKFGDTFKLHVFRFITSSAGAISPANNLNNIKDGSFEDAPLSWIEYKNRANEVICLATVEAASSSV